MREMGAGDVKTAGKVMEAIPQDAPEFSHSSPADTGTLKASNYKLYRYNNICNKSIKPDSNIITLWL